MTTALRFAVACLGVTLLACSDGGQTASKASGTRSGGVAVYCSANLPDALNSFVTRDAAAADLRPVLYTPLVLYDASGELQPNLARSWSWSEDYRTLVLRLRSDVRWHDGQAVTPQDVAWTLEIAADSAYGYWGRAELADIAAVHALEDSVRVDFRRPFALGLDPFMLLPILPKHLLGTVPASEFQKARYHLEPVGSGPFKYAGKLADGSVKLDRVADYPEELGRARLDRVVLRKIPDAASVVVELKTGGVDLCTVGSSAATEVAAAGNDVLPLAPASVFFIIADHGKPPFSDIRVRRALSAALDRAEVAATVSRVATPARNFLPSSDTRWRDSAWSQPDGDLVQAAALLDSAGWKSGATDGIRRNAAGERLRFTITAPLTLQTVLTVIQAQLRRAGFDAQIRTMEPSALFGLLGNPASRPAVVALVFTPDHVITPEVQGLFHSKGHLNLAGYAQPRVDAILERLQQPIGDEERAGLYRELQRFVALDVPIVYVAHAPRVLAVRPRLENVRGDANGPFTNVAEWAVTADQRR